MRSVKLVLFLVLVVAMVAVVLQNQASWQVRFLWLSGEAPAIVVLFLTAAAGLVMGITAALLIKSGTKRPQPAQPRRT